jgi:hypothetical protein
MRARLRQRQADLLLNLYWLVVPLLIFFIARSRLQLYLLPLFVPLALLLARPLARWHWLERTRTGWTVAVTVIAMLAAKAALAYFPADRDARAMAGAIRRTVDLSAVDEISFVGMKPFYGLRFYLGKDVGSVHVAEPGLEYSKFLPPEGLCDELAMRERHVFVAKRSKSGPFLTAAQGCGGLTIREVGGFVADDNELVLYRVRGTRTGTPPA